MFKVFLFLLRMLTVATSGVVYYSKALFKNSMLMQDVLIAQSMINRLTNSIKFSNGVYYAPYGVNIDEHHQLPNYFTGVRTSSSGMPFIYCPYSMTSDIGSEEVVAQKGGDGYDVSIRDDISSNARYYVVDSEAPPVQGIIATVILPRNGQQHPDCADVNLDLNANYTLTGDSEGKGRVFVIDHMSLENRQADIKHYYAKTSVGSESIDSILEKVAQKQAIWTWK